LSGMRIAFSLDFGYLDIEADVVRNTLETIERLKGLGAETVEVDMNWPSDIERAYCGHMDELFSASIAFYLETERELLCDYNIYLAELGLKRQQDPLSFYNAACTEASMYEEFGALMEKFDAFVCPTVMSNKLKADFNPVHDDYVVNGKVQDYDLKFSSCHYFNMMGRCPAISVPSGLGDNGVPTGLQISSKAFDDVAVFKVAAALESTWHSPLRPDSI